MTAGTFSDITLLGEGQDDIDRQLHELTSQSQVDDDLAKMKAELGQGAGCRLRGDAALRRNDTAGATRHYQRALELRPADPAAASRLMDAATYRNGLDKAAT